MSTDRTEPKGSASSSLDECQHEEAVQIAGDRLRRSGRRLSYLCNECGEAWSITAPAPAEPECESPRGCPDRDACGSSCGFADQLRGIRMMPRPAPETECKHPRPREITRGDTHSSFICDECDQTWDMHKAAPPRPPFLVAYATGSGALNELALPGEASVAVVDGSLVISHASGVLGIASVKPLELEN